MGCASGFLAILHTIILIIGLAYTAVAIYLLVEGNNYLPQGGGSEYAWTAWVPLAFGIVIVFVAFLGLCCESISKNKCFIALFSILQIAFGIVIVAAGAVLIVISGDYIQTINTSDDVVEGLPDSPGNILTVFGNIILGLYLGCCGSGFAICDGSGPYNVTETWQGVDRTFCYDDSYTNEYTAAAQSGLASQESYCAITTLADSCTASAPVSSFIDANASLLKTYVWPAGIAFCVFGGLLCLAFCASCSLLCRSSEPKQKPPKQQYAGQTAGTGNPNANQQNINYA